MPLLVYLELTCRCEGTDRSSQKLEQTSTMFPAVAFLPFFKARSINIQDLKEFSRA